MLAQIIALGLVLFGPQRPAPQSPPIAPPPQRINQVEENDKPLDLKGSRSGIVRPEQVVVRDERSFAALWKRHMRGEAAAAPHVDFSKYDVVGIFAGAKRTGGFAVEIGDVTRNGQTAVVHATMWKPGPHSLVTQAFTFPFAMRGVPKLPPSVKFEIVEKER